MTQRDTPVHLSAVRAGYAGVDVLKGVDFRADAGELVVVVGPNGAGKSTLVRAICGALPVSSGEARVFGEAIDGMTPRAIAKRIAVVHQRVDVALGFSVRAVVEMGRAPHQDRWMTPSKVDFEAVDEAMKACDLDALANRPVEQLSGGEQRRVALARGLAQRAPILILDEPTAHLDVGHALDVLAIALGATREGTACVAVLHDLNLAAIHADRIVLLQGGRVAAAGTPEEVLTRAVLEPVFGARLTVGRVEETGAPFVLPVAGRGSRRDPERDL